MIPYEQALGSIGKGNLQQNQALGKAAIWHDWLEVKESYKLL